jgi:uroporphyrinogen decarboxylase
MSTMTTAERVRRMFEHRPADRIPIADSPWGSTVERWHAEGLPKGVSYVDYFDLDKVAGIGMDNSPRYPTSTVEETAEYTVTKTAWGVTLKNWKHIASTPEFMDFTVKDPDTWRAAKARMTPTRDRINWAHLEANYRKWREQGYWIRAHGWFGFGITHSWFVGTPTVLMALAEDPDWCREMFQHELDLCLTLFDMVWDAGYTFDCIVWPDDMGYKHSQFFSPRTYRAVLKPIHEQAINWAHRKGIKALLHSCGDVNPFVPELVGLGLDGLNPLEVKAGMDPVALKQRFGQQLLFHGGINAKLWDQPALIQEEMRRVIPAMKENGGYIFSSDHSIPSSVSLADFTSIIALAKELGTYA